MSQTVTANPTSDEAVSGTWTGTAGSRYTLVDDHPDTTGVDSLAHGTTAGNLTFGFTAFNIPTGSTAITVYVDYYDGEAASGNNNAAGRLKVGGNYYNAATHNPSGTGWTSRTDTWATNPKSAAAWTAAEVNGTDGTNPLQAFGYYSSDANPAWRTSSIQLRVVYTPLAITGTAVPTAGAVSVALAGVLGFIATVALTTALALAAVAGTIANPPTTGTVAVTASPAALAASGNEGFSGTVALTAVGPDTFSSATEAFTGGCALQPVKAALTASGSETLLATSAVARSAPTLAAVGSAGTASQQSSPSHPRSLLGARTWHRLGAR